MKKIIFLSVFLMITNLIYSQAFLFRGIPWGTSKAKIIETEGIPRVNEEDYLEYSEKDVAGYKAKLEYMFQNGDELMATNYQLNFPTRRLASNDYDPTEYVNSYIDLQEKLSSLYGRPLETNNLDKIQNGISSLAVRRFQVSKPVFTIWVNSNTHIALIFNYEAESRTYSTELMYVGDENYWKLLDEYFFHPQQNTSGL